MADSKLKLEDLYTFNKADGVIDPASYQEVAQIVDSDVGKIFGLETGDVIDASTPLGRMTEWFATYFTNVLGLNVQNACQLLIAAAAGQQLDALAQWFRLRRKGATYTRVEASLTSNSATAETVVPKGSQARTKAGDVFELMEDVTIPAGGSEKGMFEAIEEGPVPCDINQLVAIDTPVTGWATVTNAAVGTLGSALETDEALRERIMSHRETAPGFIGAIKNAIEAVGDNISCMVLENNTGGEMYVQGVPMAEHSIFVCVDGFADDDKKAIAKAIFDNKPCGTGYTVFGRLESLVPEKAGKLVTLDGADPSAGVPVEDAFGNKYPVYYYAPEDCLFTTSILYQTRRYTGANATEAIRSALTNWSDTTKFKIGEAVYASDLISVIESAVPGIIVVSCNVAVGGLEKATAYVEIPAYQRALLDLNNSEIAPFNG